MQFLLLNPKGIKDEDINISNTISINNNTNYTQIKVLKTRNLIQVEIILSDHHATLYITYKSATSIKTYPKFQNNTINYKNNKYKSF